MKRKIDLSTLMFCSLFFISCHKDDTMEFPNSDQVTRDSIERVYKHKERCVLTTLCDVEELPGGSCQYTPTYGKVLYSATPTVRYKVVKDLKEAKLFFNAMLTMALDPAETVDMNPDDITYHIESRGSIRFSASSDVKTQIARVKVDFPIVPDLKEIVFIPKERWPHNDISMLRYGAVYKDKKTGYRFVCIADTKSGDGTLITFDGKKSIDLIHENWDSSVDWGDVRRTAETKMSRNTELDKKIYTISMKRYYNMSSFNQLYQLREFLYTEEKGVRQRYKPAELIFEKGVGGFGGLYPSIYGPISSWPIFPDSWLKSDPTLPTPCTLFLTDSSSSVNWDWWYDGFRSWYFYIDISFFHMLDNGEFKTIRVRRKNPVFWFNSSFVHSLSVTVDETFDPEEYLTLIYPKRNPKNR